MPACQQMQPELYHKSDTSQPSTCITAKLFNAPSTRSYYAKLMLEIRLLAAGDKQAV